MREAKRFERRITTPHFKVGTLQLSSAKGEVGIEKSAGLKFENLKITGDTVVEIPNRAAEYYSYFTDESGYTSFSGVAGAYLIPLPSELIGKELTYSLSSKSLKSGAALYLSDSENALFANLTPLCSESGITYTVKGSTFTHLVFLNVETSDKETDDGSIILVREGIIDFWQTHELLAISEISPDFYSGVVSLGNESPKIILSFDQKSITVTIPTVLGQGSSAKKLHLSRYDEITVDRKNQRVIYKDGTVEFNLTGNEEWKIIEADGGGIFAYATMQSEFSEGYCPYFTYAPYGESGTLKNVFSVFDGRNLAIKLDLKAGAVTKQTALENLINMIKEKAAQDQGVSILAHRASVIERDISLSAFGQTLLSLAVPRGKDATLGVRGTTLSAHLELEYYSLNEGAESALTVNYKTQSGDEISPPTVRTLRRGSAYMINAPEISGYNPIVSEIYGALTEDKTVVIEYKEKK